MWESIKDWLAEKIEEFLQWLLDMLLWLPKKLFQLIFDGLATFIERIPVPGFIANAQGFFSGIPSEIVYFINFFAVGEGLAMVTGALVLRFVLRRVPIIG